MAKITKLPAMSIISGFKGTLDFYLWCGIPCVRSWPRSPGHDRTPAVQAGWPAFRWAATNWSKLQPEIQLAYNAMAAGIPLTGKDLFIKGYISNTHIEISLAGA